MEILVVAGRGLLHRALALWDGDAETPLALEAEFAKPESEHAPIDPERLASSIMPELHLLRLELANPNALTQETTARLARGLGWMIETLRRWDPTIDSRGRRLEAALIMAAFWDMDGELWAALDPMLPNRHALCGGLNAVIQSRVPQVQVPENTPIWEREHLKALQEADVASDWVRLCEAVRALPVPQPDAGAVQAIRALWVLDRPRLIAFTKNIESWIRASIIVSSLSLAAAVGLAVESRSGHIRFSALDRIANREKRVLSDEEENALRNLFIVLARDVADWSVWLSVCNLYPVRHPYLQKSLGRALSRSNENAIRAYVDSIELTTPKAEGRSCVAVCLAEFRDRAALSRRTALWHCAFERWENWNFSSAEGKGLIEPGLSELDYAVVGWLVECAEPSAVTAEVESFSDQLKYLEAEWHASLGSLASGFYRLLSRYHMFAYSLTQTVKTSEWLFNGQFLTPAVVDKYDRARYRLV